MAPQSPPGFARWRHQWRAPLPAGLVPLALCAAANLTTDPECHKLERDLVPWAPVGSVKKLVADTRAALALPGVKAVLTGADAPRAIRDVVITSTELRHHEPRTTNEASS